jgi:hypothetical protein
VQEQRTRKGTQPFFLGAGGRSKDDKEEDEDREDPRAARARAQAERRAAQEQAKQEAASARAQEQVGSSCPARGAMKGFAHVYERVQGD